MAIERIDYEKCIGCGMCRDVCSCDVIRLDAAGMPFIRYPEECCLSFISICRISPAGVSFTAWKSR